MHSFQFPYRELVNRLAVGLPTEACGELLRSWLQEHQAEADWLRRFGAREPLSAAKIEDLMRLYALSRVSDILLLNFQPKKLIDEWTPSDVSLDDYQDFMLALRLRDASTSNFHPFFHEIVEVVPSDDVDEPITFLRQHWPTLMLGAMMLSRGGVTVRGGRNQIRKEIAEESTLYWAYCRMNRRTKDLSGGWGSNSQWRTSFRRDYHIGDTFYFNIDAAPEEGDLDDDDGLTPSERRELLLHRCLITSDKPHHDLWPYDEKLRLNSTGITGDGVV
jgi:hypothetical protein